MADENENNADQEGVEKELESEERENLGDFIASEEVESGVTDAEFHPYFVELIAELDSELAAELDDEISADPEFYAAVFADCKAAVKAGMLGEDPVAAMTLPIA